MSPDKYEPFGSGTIEGAFLTDIGYAFENDKEITVSAGGRESSTIDAAYVDLRREPINTAGSMPAVQIVYELTVPVELVVRSGDDVRVDGFEATWVFNDVDVESVTTNRTVVVTKQMTKSYGDVSDPYE